MDIHKILVDKKEIKTIRSSVTVNANVKKVEIFWEKRVEISPLNYQKVVEDYKKEYRRRYQEFLKYGN